MGYYTDFKITVKGEYDKEQFEKDLDEVTGYGFDYWNGTYQQNCKWYDFEDNMKEISKKYPNNLFMLDGDGEENGDIWRRAYYRGTDEYIEVKIVYEDSNLEAEFDAAEVIHEILAEEESG